MQWAAIDPTTGAAVSGVKVSAVNIDADDLSVPVGDGTQELIVGPFMLVPGIGA